PLGSPRIEDLAVPPGCDRSGNARIIRLSAATPSGSIPLGGVTPPAARSQELLRDRGDSSRARSLARRHRSLWLEASPAASPAPRASASATPRASASASAAIVGAGTRLVHVEHLPLHLLA